MGFPGHFCFHKWQLTIGRNRSFGRRDDAKEVTVGVVRKLSSGACLINACSDVAIDCERHSTLKQNASACVLKLVRDFFSRSGRHRTGPSKPDTAMIMCKFVKRLFFSREG